MNTITKNDNILRVRLSPDDWKTLETLHTNALLEKTSNIKDAVARNTEMKKLSRRKITISSISKAYLRKAFNEWLLHEVIH